MQLRDPRPTIAGRRVHACQVVCTCCELRAQGDNGVGTWVLHVISSKPHTGARPCVSWLVDSLKEASSKLMTHDPPFQVFVAIGLQSIMLAYLLVVKPYVDYNMQNLEVACHGLEVLLLCCASVLLVGRCSGTVTYVLQWIMIGKRASQAVKGDVY